MRKSALPGRIEDSVHCHILLPRPENPVVEWINTVIRDKISQEKWSQQESAKAGQKTEDNIPAKSIHRHPHEEEIEETFFGQHTKASG